MTTMTTSSIRRCSIHRKALRHSDRSRDPTARSTSIHPGACDPSSGRRGRRLHHMPLPRARRSSRERKGGACRGTEQPRCRADSAQIPRRRERRRKNRSQHANDPFAQSSHLWVDLHVPMEQPPQSIVPPHPSGPEPHCQPSVEHVPQTHAWFTHALPPEQALQLCCCPQLSVPLPHCHPSCAHVFGVHPHLLAVPPPPQSEGDVQLPHSRSGPPQPSLIVPQSTPGWQVFGVHAAVPHLFGPLPPQFGADDGQLSQANVCPQPEGTCPHSAPCALQSFGWQTHLFCTHTLPAIGHVPQSRKPPQPSFVGPHSTCRSSHDFGAHVACETPGGMHLFVAVSHTRSDGHGHVFCEKSTASTPQATAAKETIAKIRANCMRLLPSAARFRAQHLEVASSDA